MITGDLGISGGPQLLSPVENHSREDDQLWESVSHSPTPLMLHTRVIPLPIFGQ